MWYIWLIAAGIFFMIEIATVRILNFLVRYWCIICNGCKFFYF